MSRASKYESQSIRYLRDLHSSVRSRSASIRRRPRGPTSCFCSPTTWARYDVGWHGSEIKTPNLDKLALAGARLEQFYVQPVCSPTRAALLTGRYPMRHGLQVGVVRPWAEYGLPLEERTLPAGAAGGRLSDGDRRQVAPGALSARVSADAARLRSSIRPLQRCARLLHAHPRRRLRLASRRPRKPRRRLLDAPDRARGRAADARARPEPAAVSLRAVQRRPRAAPGAGQSYTEPYAQLDERRRTLRRHGRGDGRSGRPDRRRD